MKTSEPFHVFGQSWCLPFWPNPPSALVVGHQTSCHGMMSGQTKIGFMQLQLEGSLWKTLILIFYGNAFLVAFPPAFLIAQLERPCSPKSKVQFLISFKNSWQIHLAFETNRENKIMHCCLSDCPVVGARRGRRPALLFITSSLSLHLQSSRLLAANTLCHFDKYVLPFWQMQFSNWTNTQWNLDNYLLSF